MRKTDYSRRAQFVITKLEIQNLYIFYKDGKSFVTISYLTACNLLNLETKFQDFFSISYNILLYKK